MDGRSERRRLRRGKERQMRLPRVEQWMVEILKSI